MSTYKFSAAQRFAIYIAHGDKCYLCGKPIDLKTMEIDHIIPESLNDDNEILRGVLKQLGRSATFSINSYENWMPICRTCNGTKQDVVFDPSPLIQVQLQKAADKALKCAKLESDTLSNRKVANALNVLERANEQGSLDAVTKLALIPLVDFQYESRGAELADKPIRLTPHYVVLAHQYSAKHKEDVLASDVCGCFYCSKVFFPSEISNWLEEPNGDETAICPYCGIDSVIGSKSGIQITETFLKAMRSHWFGHD